MKSFYAKIIYKNATFITCVLFTCCLSGQFHVREINQKHIEMFIGLHIMLMECNNVLFTFL